MNFKIGDKLVVLNNYDRFIDNRGLHKFWKIGETLEIIIIEYGREIRVTNNNNVFCRYRSEDLKTHIKNKSMKLLK